LSLSICALPGSAQVTAFNYQGRLVDYTNPANGRYDFLFTLTDGATNPVAPAVTNIGVLASNGLFNVTLDFGPTAFDGTARWMWIGVKSNQGILPFEMLSPPQPLTPAPYAIFATSLAGGGATNINGTFIEAGTITSNQIDAATWQAAIYQPNSIAAMNGTGTNTTLTGSVVFGDLEQPYRWLSWNNGLLSIPAWNAGDTVPPIPGISFYSSSGHFQAGIGAWANHGGIVDTPELQISSQLGISLLPGQNGNPDAFVQLGVSGPSHETFNLQYDDDPMTAGWGDGISAAPLGHSKRLTFTARAAAAPGTVYYAKPGIIGFAGGTNNYPDLDQFGTELLGTMQFYASVPSYDSITVFSNHPGKWVGGTLTNGWNLRGKLIQERVRTTIDSSPYGLDFNVARFLDLVINASSVSFYTTNVTGLPSNFEQRTVVLRSGASARALSFPADWSWLSESGTASAPTNLPAGRVLYLDLSSVGIGETNIFARGWTGVDRAPGGQ
jgi:hypothetical protein